MTHLFSPEGMAALLPLAQGRALLAFDFDGTLAPIVSLRNAASMREETAALLAKVCAHYPCAVVSGRSRRDVAARLGAAAVKHIVGNHGMEPGPDLGTFAEAAAQARDALAAALAPERDVEIEDKRYSLAIHYRRSRRKPRARAAILAAISRLVVPVRVIPGKLVVNVMPDGAPNKGDALLRLSASEGSDAVLYVGDDVTDEDVFRLAGPDRLLGIRVGASHASAANYYLRTQREVDQLLALLTLLRRQRPIAAD